MRLTSTGAACPSFAAVQAEHAGMVLDNGTLTASNTIAAVGAQATGGNLKHTGLMEITSEPDALGRVPAMAGKLLMVPRISGSGYLQFIDPATGTVTTSALAIPNYTTNAMFVGSIRLPSGKILLIPFTNTGLIEYDPFGHSIRQVLAHARTSTTTIPAFSGAAVGADGIVYFSPGHHADKAICTYDERTETFAVTAMTLPYFTDWQTVENGGSVIPLPDGTLMFLTKKNTDLGAPWRVNPVAGTVTNCTRTSSTSGSTMVGGQLTVDGRHVVLAELITNKVRFYRLSDNTLFDAVLFGATLSNNTFSTCVLLQDGKVALIGNGYRAMVIVDPVGFTVTLAQGDFSGLATPADGSASNTIAAKLLSDGKVFVLSNINIGSHFTWQPYTSAPVPEGVRTNRFVDRR